VKLDESERQDIEEVMERTSLSSELIENPQVKSEPSEERQLTEQELIDEKIKNSRILGLEECLFCQFKSQDVAGNLEHMTITHGFFIPDIEYLKALEGLLKYLGEKVSIGNVCLYCNGKGKSFQTLEAVGAHMRDLNHCKLLYEGNEDEYADFYDFSADWQNIPQVEGQDETAQRPTVTVSDDGCELIFQDGKTVGHRSLNVYYRQKYRPVDNRDSVIINSLMNQYRALGWTEKWHNSQAAAREKADQRHQADMSMKLGVKANGLMRHFRRQVDV